MPAADLPLLIDAVQQAGRIASRYFAARPDHWEKPDGTGPVTEADLAVDKYLSKTLLNARPAYGWLSEESEDGPERLDRETVFIVDPIDGTRSFVEGSKTWAHSVAVAHRGVITAGAIYLPQRDLLYTAARGQGAWLNGDRLGTSRTSGLAAANILAAKTTMAPEHWPGGVPKLTRAHRPSLAYRLGLVGQGRFDAMMTFRPTWEWDVAAGVLIVEEARGRCSDRTGAAVRFNNPKPQIDGLIAAGPHLHGALISALGR